MKKLIKASRRITCSDEFPIDGASADRIIRDFEKYARRVKRDASPDWEVSQYYVPERSASAGNIRNISFAIAFAVKSTGKSLNKIALLVEMFYDPANDPAMTVTVTCPVLHKMDEYICSADSFNDTNIEGLFTIDISPMLTQINEMIYDDDPAVAPYVRY